MSPEPTNDEYAYMEPQKSVREDYIFADNDILDLFQ